MTQSSHPTPTVPPDPGLVVELELGEARANGALIEAVEAMPGNPLGAGTALVGDAVAIGLAAVPITLFNRCVGLGISTPLRRSDVDAIADFYEQREAPSAMVQLAPQADTPDASAWLEARGYRRGRRWVKTWHTLDRIEAPAPPSRIERVDPTTASELGQVVCAAFEMPPALAPLATAPLGRPGWTLYLGLEGDRPVAAGLLYVSHGIGWLGAGATLHEHRGKGWQTALLAQRLADARDFGCRLAVSETGEETPDAPVNHSYRNMLRTGFKLAYARQDWVRRLAG